MMVVVMVVRLECGVRGNEEEESEQQCTVLSKYCIMHTKCSSSSKCGSATLAASRAHAGSGGVSWEGTRANDQWDIRPWPTWEEELARTPRA